MYTTNQQNKMKTLRNMNHKYYIEAEQNECKSQNPLRIEENLKKKNYLLIFLSRITT